MTKSIRLIRVNHVNVVLEDFDASRKHFQEVYDAEFLLDMPHKEMRMSLFETGQVIFAVFVPAAWLLNARYGPHHLGIEYQADMDEARQVLTERGIRILRDLNVAVHTDPRDAFGVSFEFYGGSFHDLEWEMLGGSIKSAQHWRDEHPLGLTGLKGYTVGVYDIRAACEFFGDLLGAKSLYEEDRPAIGGRAIGLQTADCVMELVTPICEGALKEQLQQNHQGIRSTVFSVRDIDQARRYFEEREVPLIEGSMSNSFAVSPAANLGLLFEFCE